MTRTVPSTVNGIEFTINGPEVIDELEPLWLSLFDWHASIGHAALPLIERTQSWPRRKALYHEVLSTPDAFVVVARRDGQPVGYALAQFHHGPDDTWPTSDRIGEIESLAVLPDERGAGLGTELLDVAEDELANRGATTVAIAVMVGNDAAQRFYESRGMVPTTVRLLRLGPRPR
jgi:ribosomal protein S18 acetylase RimI-like enzyme